MSNLGNKEIMARNILYYMKLHHKNRTDLSRDLDVPYTTVCEWVKGGAYPRIDKIEMMANYFGIQKSDLVEEHIDDKKLPNSPLFLHFSEKKVPLIGGVACGEPIYREEDEGVSYPVPQGCDCDYCMRCHGDSMTGSGIQEGDIVYIKQMPMVDNGQMAAVRIENEYTLKIVYYDREANLITLVATNPSVAPLSYHNEQLEQIEIIGQAVGVYHDLIKQGGVL